MNSGLLVRTCAILALLPMTVNAQETGSDTDIGNVEGEAELGALITSGNTDETNIDGRFGIKYEVAEWRNTGEFRSAYSETDDSTTVEKYRATLESNYKFSERQYWLVRGSYEDDRFSGFDFQSSLTTGYGSRIWNKGKRSFLDLSVGGGYRFNKLEQPGADGNRDDDEVILRLAGRYDQALSETALFRQTLSVEAGLGDKDTTTTESETSIQADIVGSLSLKAAYLVQHLSDPPQGSEKTDAEASITLVYGF